MANTQQLAADFEQMLKNLLDRHGAELPQIRRALEIADALKNNPRREVPREEMLGVFRRVGDFLLATPRPLLEYAASRVEDIHGSVVSQDAIHDGDRILTGRAQDGDPYPFGNIGRVLRAIIALIDLAARRQRDFFDLEKTDDSLWLKQLRKAGLQLPAGVPCVLEINGTPVEFVPMDQGKNAQPTPGLKARGRNEAYWRNLPKGMRLTIRVIPSESRALVASDGRGSMTAAATVKTEPPQPARLFISYAHTDEAYLRCLDTHLAPLKREGLIKSWQDRMINPGADWATDIDRNLAEADIVLLLVSPDFVASDYCFEKEMQLAFDRQTRGEAHIVPVIIRPVDFGKMPFAKLQALPKKAKPVSTWSNLDEAWLDVVQGIRRLIKT
jgi:hypothetical protein